MKNLVLLLMLGLTFQLHAQSEDSSENVDSKSRIGISFGPSVFPVNPNEIQTANYLYWHFGVDRFYMSGKRWGWEVSFHFTNDKELIKDPYGPGISPNYLLEESSWAFNFGPTYRLWDKTFTSLTLGFQNIKSTYYNFENGWLKFERDWIGKSGTLEWKNTHIVEDFIFSWGIYFPEFDPTKYAITVGVGYTWGTFPCL